MHRSSSARRSASSSSSREEIEVHGTATRDFDGERYRRSGDQYEYLTLEKGDRVVLTRTSKVADGWAYGNVYYNDRSGWFPEECFQPDEWAAVNPRRRLAKAQRSKVGNGGMNLRTRAHQFRPSRR